MTLGLALVTTPLTAFTDDDVHWAPHCLHYLLAAFEDPRCGAAGPCQRLISVPRPSMWHFLGSAYLERRSFEFSATLNIDGGTSTLSGRLQIVRTCIFQRESFLKAFLNETWMGIVALGTADDDAFITRWLVNHGWRIRVQYCKEVELLTCLAGSRLFVNQCVRWSRTTLRSNTMSLFVDRRVWR